MPKRLELAVFDADGTLTRITSIWQYLHQRFGTWNQGRMTALRYYKGEITYDEWARLDALMWRGRELSEVLRVVQDIPFIDGAIHSFKLLKEYGMKIAVASAGLSFLANRTVRELGADMAVANELAVIDGRLTGDVRIKVSMENKRDVIREIAKVFDVSMKECAVIGDYRYDIPEDAGLKIAFNPKDDEVERLADVIVESSDLKDVLSHLIWNETSPNVGPKSFSH